MEKIEEKPEEKKYEKLYPKEPPRFEPNDVEAFIQWCTEQGASDINIQNEDVVRCEIHGKLYRVTKRRLSKPELTNIITTIYQSDGAISKLNGGEDVDLQWTIRINREKVLRYRINMTAGLVEGHKGYAITIRTITSRAPLLETLNLPSEIINNVSSKQGLIIITGATGSGKSTLLASIIDWRIRDPEAHLKILTYEHPIEYVYDDVPKPTSIVSQSEIGVHLPNFTEGVRNALRRKPSVILMGEMRDKETISEGIIASMTGHLVYGTLHSNGVAEVIPRMVNMFGAEERNAKAIDILTSLKLIVAQMLIPSTDGKRVAIREYLVLNQEIVDHLLKEGVENLTYETRRMLALYGRSFLQDATEKYEQGLISEKHYNEIRQLSMGSKATLQQENPIDKIENKKEEEVEKKDKWDDL